MLSIFSYTFFQNALLGALLSSVLCACIGTYVVTRRLVIAGGGMAHASLGGVGMGAYWGFSPIFGAACFALASGLSIDWLSRKREVRGDSAIAMIWTLGMSIGILFAYLAPRFYDRPPHLSLWRHPHHLPQRPPRHGTPHGSHPTFLLPL